LVAFGSGLAVALQFEQRTGYAGFQTVVFGLESTATGEQRPVVISAVDIKFGQGWELRTSGLWADQNRERSFDHWSYGLEAFALAIDEPEELVRTGHGHRVPLGWELDFVADGPPDPTAGETGSFTQTGTMEGLILTASTEQPLEGRARRSYWIGERPSHSDLVTLVDHPRSHPGSVILPTMFGPWTVNGAG